MSGRSILTIEGNVSVTDLLVGPQALHRDAL